jgi:hypothetical protein
VKRLIAALKRSESARDRRLLRKRLRAVLRGGRRVSDQRAASVGRGAGGRHERLGHGGISGCSSKKTQAQRAKKALSGEKRRAWLTSPVSRGVSFA